MRRFAAWPGVSRYADRKLRRDFAFVGMLVVFALSMICYLAQPLIIDVFFKFYPFKIILADGHLDKDQSPLDLGLLGTPSIGAAILVNLEFKASDTSGYPNLLQTDVGNRGVRLELNGRALALIVGGPKENDPYRGYILSRKIDIGNWHSVQLKLLSGQYVGIVLDDISVAIPNVGIPFSFANMRIGIGVDDTRRFKGQMRNINVSSSDAVVFQRFLWFSDNVAPWLLALSLMILVQRWMAYYPPTLGDFRFASLLRSEVQSLALSAGNQAIFLSALIILSGILYLISARYFLQQDARIVPTLLPGFSVTTGAPSFKTELLLFILLEMCLAGTLALTWISSCLNIFQKPIPFRNYILIAFGAAAASIAVSDNVARIIIVSSCVPLLLQALLSTRANLIPPSVLAAAIGIARCTLSVVGLAYSAADRATRRLFPVFVARNAKAADLVLRIMLIGVGILICGLLAWPFFQAWAPITIPNDYMEIQDVVRVDGSPPVSVERAELARCLEATEKPDSPPTEHALAARCDRESLLSEEDRSRLQGAVKATAVWQAEAGRTLFHHSYIFVPARHFLAFGLDRAFPYLYGFGNTLFHAMLMSLAGGASISTYFSTLPIAEMFGLVAIGLLVLLVTRNVWAAFTGFALSLAAFYLITYVPVFLAASFSPLRFFGLVLQFGAMCLCCRTGRESRFVLLPLAAIASLFWNVEFALLGLPGEILLLLSPQIRLTLQLRGLLLMALIASAAIFMVVSRTSSDVVSTVRLSFFNVGMPYMTYSDAMWFFLTVASAQVALFGLSFLFAGPERTLRIAFLPCLALLLIKYIFNPSPPHLYVVLTLLWPICLTYLPWASSPGLSKWSLPRLIAPAVAIIFAFVAAQGGRSFKEQSSEFRSAQIDNFKIGQWTQLGETIGFVAPEEEFYERVVSIKSHVRPDDTLVLLSPYDHILNFYVNQQNICGHFDLFTNLATREIANRVIECATRSAQTMIVYDRSAETRCPTDPLQSNPRCALKFDMKTNLIDLKNRLLPFVELVGSDKNLEFYRPRSDTAH